MHETTPYELGIVVGIVIADTAIGMGVLLLLNAALKKWGTCKNYHPVLIGVSVLPVNCAGVFLFGVTLWNRLHGVFVVLLLLVSAGAYILYMVRTLWRKIRAERD